MEALEKALNDGFRRNNLPILTGVDLTNALALCVAYGVHQAKGLHKAVETIRKAREK